MFALAQPVDPSLVSGAVHTALSNWERGYNVIPMRRTNRKGSRTPLTSYKRWQTERQTRDDVIALWRKFPDADPAILCGPASGVFAVEIDDVKALKWFEKRGEIPATMQVSRDAEGRIHLYFKWPGFTPRNGEIYPGVEVKATLPIHAPGARHWTGAIYRIVNDRPPAAAPEWLLALIRPAERPAISIHSRLNTTPNDDARRVYANTALNSECDALASLRDGEKRHYTIYGAALRMGGLVGAGVLDRATTEHTLFAASEANGYVRDHGEAEARRHIRNGLRKGESEPRDLQNVGTTVRAAKYAATVAVPFTVPDSVRRALLKTGLKCAAPTIELIYRAARANLIDAPNFSVPELMAANETLGLHVSRASVYRALPVLSDAVDFFSELHTSISLTEGKGNANGEGVEENTPPRSERAPRCQGRRETRYRVKSPAELIRMLRYRLFEHHFADTIPNFAAEHFTNIVRDDENAENIAETVNAILAPVRDGKGIKRRMAAYRADLRALNDPTSTPFPDGTWGRVADYEATFTNARLQAETRPAHSRRYLAEQVGRSPRTASSLLERANIRNEPQPPISVNVGHPQDVCVAAKNAARKARGKIMSISAARQRKDGTLRVIDTLDLVDRALDQAVTEWTNKMKWTESIAFEVVIQPPARQIVMGDVQPSAPRKSRAVTTSDDGRNPAVPPTPRKPRPARPTYARPEPDPLYVRDALLLAHSRLMNEPRVDGDLLRLTARDALDMVLADGRRLPDVHLAILRNIVRRAIPGLTHATNAEITAAIDTGLCPAERSAVWAEYQQNILPHYQEKGSSMKEKGQNPFAPDKKRVLPRCGKRRRNIGIGGSGSTRAVGERARTAGAGPPAHLAASEPGGSGSVNARTNCSRA